MFITNQAKVQATQYPVLKVASKSRLKTLMEQAHGHTTKPLVSWNTCLLGRGFGTRVFQAGEWRTLR